MLSYCLKCKTDVESKISRLGKCAAVKNQDLPKSKKQVGY